MKIRLITLGNSAPKWVSDGYSEYAKRFRQDVQLELVKIALPTRHRSSTTASNLAREYEYIQAARRKGDLLILLDPAGEIISTEQLSEKLQGWQNQSQPISLVIGGPDGLDPCLKDQSIWSWSLSRLTFPHPLVRILVAEQLYRAWSILHNHPYHRGA